MARVINGFYDAIEIAQRIIKEEGKTGTYGVTEGQILHFHNGRLAMRPCWFSIDVTYDHQLILIPLLPKTERRDFFKHVTFTEDFLLAALGEDFLETVTTHRYNISGKTARTISDPFWVNPHKPILPQVEQIEWVVKPNAVEHNVLEYHGDLIISKHTLLQLPDPRRSFRDKFNNYVNDYNGTPIWSEPNKEYKLCNPENPAPEGIEPGDKGFHDYYDDSDYDELSFHSCCTGFNATLVPTLWIKDEEGTTGEFFVDFAGDWKTSKYGDTVSTKVGKFVFSHRIKNGKMTTRTSLRITDSAWYQEESAS